jgi:hypothetical protein
MGWFKREWSNILTIGCIIVAAIIEAWQQALAGSPRVAESLPSLDGSWHYVPLGLLIIAGVSWFIGRYRKPSQGQQQGAALQTALGISAQPPVDFDATRFFRLAYHSDWTADVEKRIRVAAHQNQPNDHEDFYAKFIGVGMVAYYHGFLAWDRPPMTRVGMVGSSSALAAWTRPCPLRVSPASSTRTGAVKPNFWILVFSLASCLSLWVRGFPGHGLRSPGRRSIRPLATLVSSTSVSLVLIRKLLLSVRSDTRKGRPM